MKSKENPWLNLAFNVLIPVVVLQQLSRRLGSDYGPTLSLFIALAFPVGYGVWDYLKAKKLNPLSLLGLVSVLFTGGFALVELNPLWFAIKEAAFPGLIGLAIALSAQTQRPFFKVFIANDNLLNMDLIDSSLCDLDKRMSFENLVKISTRWSAVSFFLSAGLNFTVARWIYQGVSPDLPAIERSALLNEQVARMTGYGFLLIALPMTLFMGGVLWHFLTSVSKLTGHSVEVLLQPKNKLA